MLRIIGRVFLFVIIILSFAACKPQVPSEYIQPGDMEDILYDYHIVDAMADTENDSEDKDYDKLLYRKAVLKKYDVTEAEFDSSMVYYSRHSDRLHSIYENISQRLSNEALALGASSSDIKKYGDVGTATDTADVWKDSRFYVFTPNVPQNVHTFRIPADSTFRGVSKFVLSFDTHFIYQEGSKTAVAQIALRLSNDSVVTRMIYMSSNTHYSIAIEDDENLGVKELYGFIFLSKNMNATKSTLKLMFVNNIKLVKLYTKPKAAAVEATPKDSLRVDSLNSKAADKDTTSNSPMRRNDVLKSPDGALPKAINKKQVIKRAAPKILKGTPSDLR